MSSPVKNGVATGVALAAAVLLFVGSLLAVFQGISAIADDQLFVAGPNYVYSFDLTTWGWIHLVLGVIGIVVAFALATGAEWARITAIAIATLSIVAQFLWLPYYPIWAIIVMVLDAVVIWAVATWRPDAV